MMKLAFLLVGAAATDVQLRPFGSFLGSESSQVVNVRYHNKPSGFLTQKDELELDLIPPTSFIQNEEYTLHVPSESAQDLQAAGSSILATEEARAAAANSEFNANKKALLAAAIGRMKHAAFLTPVALSEGNWQASLPTEVTVNYDVPKSFMQTVGDDVPNAGDDITINV
jgi:hypothetical protein